MASTAASKSQLDYHTYRKNDLGDAKPVFKHNKILNDPLGVGLARTELARRVGLCRRTGRHSPESQVLALLETAGRQTCHTVRPFKW